MMKQVYGITTYDAIFKYVLSEDSIRPSFFHAFLPGLDIVSSVRLDDHMNPVQSFQLLRQFIHKKTTRQTMKTLRPGFAVVDEQQKKLNKATAFLQEISDRFEEIQMAFPKPKFDGTMDFVCALSNGEYALIEMQVIPQDYFDRRALAYVASFYGNQLNKTESWKDLKKVIGINILGGGKDQMQRWPESEDEYVRHYKFQDQLNGQNRIIDGIELIQYSIMNSPKEALTEEQEDWLTFFKRGHTMTEEEVSKIKTESVRIAFKRAVVNDLPRIVRKQYEEEDTQYERYSEFTDKQVEEGIRKGREEGRAEGREEGILIGEERGEHKKAIEMAKKMKKAGFSATEISEFTGLSRQEINEI
jgi:predicted transposase/invertase (TIGR01784 family)